MGEIIAIIPARAGSKRIPGKNIKELAGFPLIEHTILSAVGCNAIDHVVITSNIENCNRFAEKYGIRYVNRPDILCEDDSNDYDVIQHALRSMDNRWELIVYLRPTTPFRSDYHLCEAIKTMRDADKNATGLRSVEEMGESAFKCYTMPTPWLTPIHDDAVDKTDWPNQRVTPTYHPNGYIDIVRPETLAKGQLWGDWCVGYVTPHTIEIDTQDDWDYAEWYANRSVDAPMQFGRRTV